MKKQKKVKFGDLKTGQTFKYYNNIYIKDNCDASVNLKNGRANFKIYTDTVVTPVKVKITVIS